MKEVDSLNRLTAPLLKSLVYPYRRPQESYANKWNLMREKRNDRFKREMKKDQRKEMRAMISGLVATNDKSICTKRLRDQENLEQFEKDGKPSLSLSLRFKGLSIFYFSISYRGYLSLSVLSGALESKPLSSSITSYSNTSARIHHTSIHLFFNLPKFLNP